MLYLRRAIPENVLKGSHSIRTVCQIQKRCLQSEPQQQQSNVKSVTDAFWDSYKNAREVAATASTVPQRVSPSDVFANNELHLSDVDAYGFDYDYTLAVYTKDVNLLIYELALSCLIEEFKYPADIADMSYDPTFAVRGIHYDIERGLLLKLDSFCHIQYGTVYRGKHQLSDGEVREIYKGTVVPRSLVERVDSGSSPSLKQLMDLFSLPELGLLSNVITYFTEHGIEYHPESLFHDVEGAVNSIHVTGLLHRSIAENRERFIHYNEHLRPYLDRLKRSEKMLFLLTNSPYLFVNDGMEYLIGADWIDFFDYVVVNARKPAFFKNAHKPFRYYHRRTDRLSWTPISYLRKGAIYAEGNIDHFLRATGLTDKTVLYFGDHMYSELADRLQNACWRTAAIVPELMSEIRTINDREYIRTVLWLQALTGLIERHLDEAMLSTEGIEVLKQWKNERNEVRRKARSCFNPNFGSMFRTYHNPTFFSRRLMQLSDVYTSSVSNFDKYSLDHIFYTRRVALPHEFNISLAPADQHRPTHQQDRLISN